MSAKKSKSSRVNLPPPKKGKVPATKGKEQKEKTVLARPIKKAEQDGLVKEKRRTRNSAIVALLRERKFTDKEIHEKLLGEFGDFKADLPALARYALNKRGETPKIEKITKRTE